MILEHLPLVIAVAAGIIGLKTIVAGHALVATATPMRVAIAAAIGLSQVGEFSFILGRSGLESGLLPLPLWQVLLGASVATMVVTPALLGIAPSLAVRTTRVAENVRERVGRKKRAGDAAKESSDSISPGLTDHVIILGFGSGGRLMARALHDLGIPYLVLELNGATVRHERAQGEHIIYGDATSPESLEAACVDRALAIVSLLSDPDATRRMVRLVRQHAPSIQIIARTRYRLEADRLLADGASVAVAEEQEASLEVLAQLLGRLDIPGNVIEPLLDVFRRESVSMRSLKAPFASPAGLPQVLQHLPVSTHQVEGKDWAADRTMSEINLRARTGATALAIQRSGSYVTPVPPDEHVLPSDVLYLVGDESDILLARRLLTSGE
jgi:monovalent cation:H+ antiporter-2, CPA2 family